MSVSTNIAVLLCRIIANNNAFMISGRIDRDGYIEYRFVSSFESFRRILRELHRAGLSFRVNRVVRYKPKGILTETQERILLIALRAGFFDFPRRVTLEELAKGIGVFPFTLSEVIRRGLYMRY